LKRLIIGFLVFATIFSLFYVAKLLRISGEPSKQASGKKTITDFQVENHYVIYDGKSFVYHPKQFDFRILDSQYRGANSWQFTAAFLVWDDSDPNTHGFPADPLKENGELKDATRLVLIRINDVTDPEKMFEECVKGEPIWCTFGTKIREGEIKYASSNSNRSGKMIIWAKKPDVINFYTPRVMMFPTEK